MDKEVKKDLEILIAKHFPEYSDEIRTLYNGNERFVELINDFIFCEQEIKKLINLNKNNDIQVFKDALADLKEEIMEYMIRTKV
jgi:uncharacterized protein YdcH (DUF465 family)